MGQPVGGGQLWEACSATDIRRWVHAMDYPNPIHWNQEFARQSKFGGIVAPQSFVVCMDYGHGVHPACVGRIPGSHLIFGGEEWWFYGPRIKPGDRLSQERRFHGYKVADTKFAGPTMFSSGDTLHTNQHGVPVAKERSTSIRYLAAEAEKRGFFENDEQPVKRWTRNEIEGDREDADRLAASPIGSASRRTSRRCRSATGCRAARSARTRSRASPPSTAPSCSTRGARGTGRFPRASRTRGPTQDAGWIDGFGFDEEGAKIDPRKRDGLFMGPSRGHVDYERAGEIGMFRAYGYGATMGAWTHDYVAYWAGHDGYVRHSKSQFRAPAFEGDVTYVDARGDREERRSPPTACRPSRSR